MRVLLISANSEMVPDPVYPIGAAAVGGSGRAASHDVSAIDLWQVRDREGVVRDAIHELAPDVVAISLRNLDNSAYPENRIPTRSSRARG